VIEKVVTGGQAGADQGGLRAARAAGIATGGFAPKGWATEAGPGHPGRLDAGNVARIAHSVGRRAGVARGTNPHGLRHQGITRALALAHGDVRKVRRFSRHAKLETLLKYDDNRVDEAGAIARMLGEDSA
jgi:integrase